MAVISFGYPGTIDPGVTWADAQLGLGSRYWVRSFDSVRVTPKVGGSREVNISAGWFGGWGVTDYNDAVATVQLPTVASGTEWFLIVARRTWGVDAASSATTFAAISAGTTAAIPTRNTTHGEVDDQPLALVSLTAGQTLPAGTIDVRAIGIGPEDFIILSELALTYLAEPGVRARLGRTIYQYGMNAGNNGHAWIADPGPLGAVDIPSVTGASVLTPAPGWTVIDAQATRYGNVVDLYWVMARTAATIVSNTTHGNVGDQPIATVAAAWRPPRQVMFSGVYRGGRGAIDTTYTGEFFLSGGGALSLQSLYPGADLKKHASNIWSVWGHLSYIQF